MKKDKSIYHLLNDLPDRVGKKEISADSSAPADQHDFSEEMKNVKKINHDKTRVKKTGANRIAITHNNDGNDYETVDVTNLPEYMEGYIEGINPVTLEKLRSGEFAVQKTLDLHGYGIEEGYRLFHEFLQDAIRSKVYCIKVIHGRGLKSKRGPVLKEQLKKWLIMAMHRRWITAFSSSVMKEGGPGATNILLRHTPVKRKIRIIG